MSRQHRYRTALVWVGNDGSGTATYRGYRRDHLITADGKPPLPGSSDPLFRGDGTRYNPEELLVASLSACHMLWYLHLCADRGVVVVEYRDEASGTLQEEDDGGGSFVQVLLKPRVRISADSDRCAALALHERAHQLCFIARSVTFPVRVEAQVLE